MQPLSIPLIELLTPLLIPEHLCSLFRQLYSNCCLLLTLQTFCTFQAMFSRFQFTLVTQYLSLTPPRLTYSLYQSIVLTCLHGRCHSDANAEGSISLSFVSDWGHVKHILPLPAAVHDPHVLTLGRDCILLLPEAFKIVKDRPWLLAALAWRVVRVAISRQLVLTSLAT